MTILLLQAPRRGAAQHVAEQRNSAAAELFEQHRVQRIGGVDRCARRGGSSARRSGAPCIRGTAISSSSRYPVAADGVVVASRSRITSRTCRCAGRADLVLLRSLSMPSRAPAVLRRRSDIREEHAHQACNERGADRGPGDGGWCRQSADWRRRRRAARTSSSAYLAASVLPSGQFMVARATWPADGGRHRSRRQCRLTWSRGRLLSSSWICRRARGNHVV